LDILDNAYNGGFKAESVYSGHLEKIIKSKSNDLVLRQKAQDIVRVEQTVRNPAAHTIVSVTAEWIRRETQKTPQEIMSVLKYLLVKAGINAKDTDWKSYDNMNEKIIKYLR